MDEDDHLLKGHSKPGKDETWNPKGNLAKGENPNRNFILLVKNPCVFLSVIIGSLQSLFVMTVSFQGSVGQCKSDIFMS